MDHRRRRFLRWVGGGLLVMLLVFFRSAVKGHRLYLKQQQKPLRLPLDLPEGLSFHGKVIVVRDGDEYHVFSARCAHLGCIVDRTDKDTLVCPCHGSRYSLNGRLLQGPATHDLVPLRFRIDSKENSLVIEQPA